MCIRTGDVLHGSLVQFDIIRYRKRLTVSISIRSFFVDSGDDIQVKRAGRSRGLGWQITHIIALSVVGGEQELMIAEAYIFEISVRDDGSIGGQFSVALGPVRP